MRTIKRSHAHRPVFGDQSVIVLPGRETLALLKPGLGIIDLGPMTSGPTSGGELIPVADPSGGAAPTTGTAPPTGAAPTTGMDLPTTSLPAKLF